MSENWSDFVEESNERITRLNNELLALERDPADEEAMRKIFRIAHTLKGNAGAAGFEAASDLAHAIEDLLDAVRSGRLEVTTELMDVVFDAVDELETMIDEIDAAGEIETDPSATIRTVRDALESETTVTTVTTPPTAEIETVLARLEPPADDDHDAYLVRFAVTEDGSGDTTNAILVVEALIDAFDLVGTDPARERLAAGEYDGQLDAVFGSAVGERAIAAALEPIDVIADFEIVDVTDRFTAVQTSGDDTALDSATDESAISQVDAQELEVDDLLDEFDEFDDLEEKVKEVENDDDLEVFDEMGDAGSFDDLLEDAEEIDPELEPGDPASGETEASGETTGDGSPASESDDAEAVFAELKDEVDPVGFEELQDELDELEFDEFDEEEVGMDDLLGDEMDDDSIDESAADLEAETESERPASETESAGLETDSAKRDDATATDAADTPVSADADTATTAEPAAAESVDTGPADAGVDPDPADAAPADVDPVDADPADADPADVDPANFDSLETSTAEADTETPADSDDSTTVADEAASPVDDEAGDAVSEPPETSLDDASSTAGFDEESIDTAETGVDEGPVDSTESGFDEESFEPTETGFADASLDSAESGFDEEPVDSAESGFADASFESTETGFDDASFEPTDSDESGEWAARDTDDASFESGTADAGDGSAETSQSDDESFEPTETDTSEESVDSIALEESAEDVSSDLLDLEGDDDSFEETFGADALEERDFEDGTDSGDGWFDAADSATADGANGEAGATTDGTDSEATDEIVTTIEEPNLEIPDLTVPDSIGRDDAETVSNEAQSVRVDAEQIDDLLTLVEGLVTSRVRLRHAVETDLDRDAIETELDDLEGLLTDLQGTVMDVRLVPVETITNRLPRIVRDVAREQDKEVAFEMAGSDVEIDRTILDRLRDPLVHLVRNAVDHGIEPPEQRAATDKPREGQVEVTATRARDQVTIRVSDDGRGLDPDRLRAEAVDAGVLTEAESAAMSDDDAFELVFHPGLSTAEEVTDVSGRGVGMDVVERTVEELDGSISIDSDVGEGTTVTMTLPVSIAIDDVLFVECGGEEFGVPTTAVHDIEPVDAVEVVDGEPVLPVDDETYPVLSLEDELETPASEANGDEVLVRIRDDVRPVALQCDHVRGQQEVVVKPFEGFMRDIPGLGGATVRGRGEVVNILDVTTL